MMHTPKTQLVSQKRPRGSGSIFKNRGCTTWTIKFYDRGRPRYESSRSTDQHVAEKLLKRRLAEVTTDTYVPRANIKIDELILDVLSEQAERGRKTISDVRARWRLHLQPFFGGKRAGEITTDQVRRYTAIRLKESAKPATLNRELSILKHAFKLALKSTPAKVKTVPYIPQFKEADPRKGFLRDEEYDSLVVEASKEGLWLRALLAIAYNFGWRKSEMLGLRVQQIDLLSRTIRLDPGSTKNGRGRLVHMPDEVYTLLTAQVAGKQQSDHVFTRKDGKPIKSFRKLWRTVCKRAGVPELLLHDLRRTGVRNLRRLGVAESIAMQISGHLTASVFRRYDITDESDMVDVAARLDEKRAARKIQFGDGLVMVGENSTKNNATADLRISAAVLPN